MENEVINIEIIIATDKLMREHPYASQDPNNPTPIGHQYAYMVASGSAMDVRGSGTGDLSFAAEQGDILRVSAISEYNNFGKSVLLYGLFRYSGADIFAGRDFMLESFPEVETPYPVNFEPLEVELRNQAYWTAQNTFQRKGQAGVGFQFGVWTTHRGQSPSLVGFYQWDPTITVE